MKRLILLIFACVILVSGFAYAGGARVPAADSTNNRLDVEVIGNKADTASSVVGTTKSVVSYLKGILNVVNDLEVSQTTGTADIDVSEFDYTAYTTILAIAPATGAPLSDVRINLDLNKATTGWDTIANGSDTIDIIAMERVDGTNWRRVASASQVTANGSGALSLASSGVSLDVGNIGVTTRCVVAVKLNAERDDFEIPYDIQYVSSDAPTVYDNTPAIPAAYILP